MPGPVDMRLELRPVLGDATPLRETEYLIPAAVSQDGQVPAYETMETAECCRQVLRATARRDRDLVMTWRGKIGRLLKLVSPALVDAMARRVIASRQ